MRFSRAFVFYTFVRSLMFTGLSFVTQCQSIAENNRHNCVCGCVDLCSEIMWKIASNCNDHVKYSINEGKNTAKITANMVCFAKRVRSFSPDSLAAVVSYTNFFVEMRTKSKKIIKEEYKKNEHE